MTRCDRCAGWIHGVTMMFNEYRMHVECAQEVLAARAVLERMSSLPKEES